ncbi:MAG: RNA methyltransferase [Saprospiraceae bacterium]|nr:RNA methyltransferase [Saprospiraceae bacterium]
MLSASQQKFLTSLHVKKYRQKYRKFIVEGDKLVCELLCQQRIGVHALFGLDTWATQRADLLFPYQTKFTPVTEAELKKISTLTTPNQVLAVAEMPVGIGLDAGAAGEVINSPPVISPTPNPSPHGEGSRSELIAAPLPGGGGVGGGVNRGVGAGLNQSEGFDTESNQKTGTIPASPLKSLYLDGIQDPGNMGTILRIADWFGLSPVYCSPDCVDPYSPKVVQAGMGAVLRVLVEEAPLEEVLARLEGWPVLGADMAGEDVFKAPLPERGLLIIGNEGRGLSAAAAARLTRRVSIPRPPGGAAESLNAAVATGILAAVWTSGQ